LLPRPQGELKTVDPPKVPRDEAELDALMARLADGERAAFEPLFRALHPRAFRLARARTGDEARAADVAQGALVALFARASEYDPGRAVLPWFYGIVSNELRSMRRKDARHAQDERALGELIAEGDPELELIVRELRAALETAVAALDAKSAESIAALLGAGDRPRVAAPVFRKRVSRAYARLRVLLGVNR
jgi:RNA polymerase sigma-70 factor (ECF subfamily)